MTSQKRQERFVLLTTQGIGNTLLALPILKALKKKQAMIDAVVSDNGASEVLQLMNVADHVLDWKEKFPPLINFMRLAPELLFPGYDRAYALCPAGRRENMLLRLVRAAKKYGWKSEHCSRLLGINQAEMMLWDEKKHDLESNAILTGLGNIEIKTALEDIRKEIRSMIRSPAQSGRKLLAGFQPLSHVRAKCWPPHRFSKFLNALQEHFPMEIQLFGSNKEEFDLEQIRQRCGKNIRVRAGCSWREVFGAIAGLDFFMGVDSSISHLSALAGIPSCILYGVTDPARTAALGQNVLLLQKDHPEKASYIFSQGYQNQDTYNLPLKEEEVLKVVLAFLKSLQNSPSERIGSIDIDLQASTLPFGARLMVLK